MLQRICIVIPSRDSAIINDMVKALVQETPYSVWVLDDGTSTPVQDSLYSWDVRRAVETERVRIRQGADAARILPDLRSAGYTHMVTVPAMAPSRAREIKLLVGEAEKDPFAIVAAKTEKGELRPALGIYPLFELQNFKILGGIVPFIPAVLAEARARGVNFRFIDVEGAASEWAARGRDRVQWSLALFFGGLFRPPQRRCDRALAVATGAGLGVLAFPYVAWTLAVFSAAIFRLRLTWIAASLATTIYFFKTFAILGAIYIGQKILNIQFALGSEPHLRQWQVGSLVLAVLTGSAVFVLARALEWTRNHLPIKGLRSLGEALLRRSPDRVARLALLFYWPYFALRQGRLRRDLMTVRHSLFPEESRMQRLRHILLTLGNAASFAMDRVRLEISFAPEAAYPGAMLLTAQIGNWPWLAGRAEVVDARDGGSIELIPFMGRLVAMDVSAFERAADKQIPVRFCYFIKDEAGGYQWVIREPRLYDFTSALSREFDVYLWARDFVKDAEEMVMKFPNQYLPIFPSGSKCPPGVRVKTWTGPLNSLTRVEATPTL